MKYIRLTIPLIAAFISISIVNADYGTTKQRHDLVKSFIGLLDDKIVASGLISDYNLHKIGAVLGICEDLK